VNGDGLDDVGLQASDGIYVYLGDDRASGTRTVPNIHYSKGVSTNYKLCSAGDLDNDGFDEIVFADGSNEILYLNYGP
jgi:hypothetical protein